jgi:hypothetical protein
MEALEKLVAAAEAFTKAERENRVRPGQKFLALEKEIEPAKAELAKLKEGHATA